MTIFCVQCGVDIQPRLTSGKELYPHRPDLYSLPFWKCDSCGGYVGCHHKTADRTRPLGCIPSPEILRLRKKIHAVLDPIWQSRKITRRRLYAKITDSLGYEYHTGNLRSTEEAERVLEIVESL